MGGEAEFRGRPYYKLVIDGVDLEAAHPGLRPAEPISFEDEPSKLDNITITFKNVNLDIVDSEFVQEDHEIVLEWGVWGVWSLERQLKIGEVSVTYGNQIDITVNCVSNSTSLSRKSGAVFSGKTSSQIAELIASRLGYKKNIVSTKIKRTVAQGFRSYAALLRKLAEDEGYIFRVANNTLHFLPVAYDELPENSFEYRFNGQGNLLRFTASSKATGAKGAAQQDKAIGIHGTSGVPEKSQSSQETVTGQGVVSIKFEKGGGFSAISTQGGSAQEEPNMSVSPHQKDVTDKSVAASSRRALWRTTQARALVLNEPIEPNVQYQFTGLGSKLSGSYLCKKVTHRIYTGKIESELELRRAATSKDSKRVTPDKPTVASQAGASGGNGKVVIEYKRGGGFSAKSEGK